MVLSHPLGHAHLKSNVNQKNQDDKQECLKYYRQTNQVLNLNMFRLTQQMHVLMLEKSSLDEHQQRFSFCHMDFRLAVLLHSFFFFE